MQAKNQLHPSHFPQVIYLLQRYCKLVLVTMDMPSYAHPKWYYQLIENFHLYLQAKSQLHPPCFSEDWLSAFWPISQEKSFAKYGIGGEISRILVFILYHFIVKLFKFLINFSKNPNKIIIEPIWVLFAKTWSKMNFRGKEGSASF